MEPVEPAAGDPAAPALGASALRRSLLRAVFAGASGAGVCVLLATAFDVRVGVWFLSLLGFFCGGILGAAYLLEVVGWGRHPSAGGLLGVAAGVAMLAATLCWGAELQTIYLSSVLQGRGNAQAWDNVVSELLFTLNYPDPWFSILALVGVVFGVASVARGCGIRTPESVSVCVVGGVPVSAAVLLGTRICTNLIDPRFAFGMLAATALLLPVLSWLGDGVERRVFQSAQAQLVRRRSVAWGSALGLLVLGTPLGYVIARARVEARLEFEYAYYALLQDALQAEQVQDHATCYELSVKIDALPLGILDERENNDRWLYAAWWTGRPMPPNLTAEQIERARDLDREVSGLLQRAELRLNDGQVQAAKDDLEAASAVSQGSTTTQGFYLLQAEVCARLGDASGMEVSLLQAKTLGATADDLATIREQLVKGADEASGVR